MPNYIYNTLIMKGSPADIAEVRDAIKSTNAAGKSVPIDFNRIIPMPPELDIENISTAFIFHKLSYQRVKLSPSETDEISSLTQEEVYAVSELAQKYQNNIKNFGSPTWYEWSTKHWGTKWNAVITDDCHARNTEDHIIYFTTAWDAPIPIMNTLACKYPNISFTLEYFDEQSPKETITAIFKVGEKEHPKPNINL